MEQNNRLPIFKERLRTLMGNASNTEFAKSIGISRQTLGFYLNGDRIPDCETLVQICRKCNVSSNWLLGLSDDPAIKSHTVDELGLSSNAVNVLLNIGAREESTDILEGLNLLLENISIIFLGLQIKRAKDCVQREAAFAEQILKNEYDPNESLLPSDNYLDISDLDLADNLEAKIVEYRPELLGRISISCGRSALDIKLNEIKETFDYLVKSITGYHNYLQNRIK